MPTLILRAHSAAIYANNTGDALIQGGSEALADQSDTSYVSLGNDTNAGVGTTDYATCVFDNFDAALAPVITARRFFIRASGMTHNLGEGQSDFFFGFNGPDGGPALDVDMASNPAYMEIVLATTIPGYGGAAITLSAFDDDTYFISCPGAVDPSFPATGVAAARWNLYEAWIELDYDSLPNASNVDAVRSAPAMRIYPRDDGRGAASAARIWPPPSSIQASNRPTGYL
jgi:hypothetical protein